MNRNMIRSISWMYFWIWHVYNPSNVECRIQKTKKYPSHLSQADSHGSELSKQIEDLLRDHSYELSIRPRNEGTLTKVGLDLLIESITDISEKNMDVTFTLCLHETWIDRRLKFNARGNNESIVLPSRLIKKIWVPDVYIVGSKSSFIHGTTVDNVVARLFSDGKIFYSLKITTTVACQMNLYNFPLDIENCSLTFQSLGHTTDEVILYWSSQDEASELFLDIKLVKNMPKFQLLHHKYHSSNISLKQMARIHGSERSRLQISFELRRYPLAVFFQSYFPALAMVLLAGLGMWIDPKSVPARVSLGVTSVLTISTITTGLKATLPKVSYLTAMDIYLWVCFLFVFSTVIEFCVLNFFMTKHTKQMNARANKQRTTGALLAWERYRKRFCLPNDVAGLDVFFRIAYFAAFALFNIVYWLYYSYITHHDGND